MNREYKIINIKTEKVVALELDWYEAVSYLTRCKHNIVAPMYRDTPEVIRNHKQHELELA